MELLTHTKSCRTLLISSNVNKFVSFLFGVSSHFLLYWFIPNRFTKRERILRDIDDRKIEMIENFISECKTKGIELLFFISPRYKTVTDKDYFNFAISIAKRNDIPVCDFRNVSDISENPNFFNDPLHMNNDGAMYYTQHYICEILKNVR